MRRLHTEDDGIAMIAAIMLGLLAAIVVAVFSLRTFRNYDETLAERQWTEALNVAESGIDKGIFELNEDPSYHTVPTSHGYPTPFTDSQAERAWVLSAVSALGLASADSGNGQYVIVKPEGQDVIYAAGYLPSQAQANATRVIKLRYGQVIAPPPSIGEALVLGGNLYISGNPNFTGSHGSIHSNGNLTSSGTTTASGHASSAGSYSGTINVGDPGASGSTGEIKEIPLTDPLDLHYLAEYDMCNNGRVYAGPAYTDAGTPATVGVPCSGSQLAVATSTEYRGWKMGGTESDGAAKWDYVTDSKFDGSYFFDGGNAKIGANPGEGSTPWKATLITNPIGGISCPNNRGGDIEFSGNPYMIPYAPAEPWLLVAGRDLKVSGNADSYGSPSNPGLVTGIEQLNVSGNPNVYGAFLIRDNCDTTGSLLPRSDHEISGEPNFTFNGEFSYPLTTSSSTETVFRWNEL